MPAEVAGPRVATPQDRDVVVAILVSAFYDDPTWSWAFPNPALRSEQHARLWGLFVDGALRYPWVWLGQGDTAASVWIPPDGTDLSHEQEATLEPSIVEMLGADAAPVLEALGLFERAHPRDVPHFFLSLLGTRVEHRGRGHGLALLAANLRRIDELGMPAYLEASNPANVALYARYGFDVIGSFELPGDGPTIFTMWRDATPLG
ncbi:GNAT family N-acetyltransferase [Lacisediminihabitans profunda]|uniref:GNAT family N-acetyltransferase n=1 Tax=Lacisediminihabitans profunda TaxID=2594790 RepID=A0A5C8UU93_9MICO|nr:GNAT family N-acetyltransferase [Lacisediminihabitans profunda]TXN31876.1 GNAT family N-acetyltransferase [Lacisediminihabitans profunda]